MKQKRCSSGFSMLEVMLAIIVIVVAGVGAYELFSSGLSKTNTADAEDEAVQIANVYTDLASSNLTTSGNDIPTLLQKSGRISTKYFSTSGTGGDDVQMYNAFGTLTFTDATPYSFTVQIPLGCSSGDVMSDSSLPGQFYSKVKDSYSCTPEGSKEYSDCTPKPLPCTAHTQTKITLYFNMNH